MTIICDITGTAWLSSHDLPMINAMISNHQTVVIDRPERDGDDGLKLIDDFYDQPKRAMLNSKFIVGAYEVQYGEVYEYDLEANKIGF